MKEEDHDVFIKAINVAYMQVRQQEINPKVAVAYYMRLIKYPIETVLEAIDKTLLDSNGFFPTAMDIERYCNGEDSDRAEVAASEIESAPLGRSNIHDSFYVTVNLTNYPPDPLRDEALRRMPLPNAYKDRPFWRKDFIALYHSLAKDTHRHNYLELTGNRTGSLSKTKPFALIRR